MGLSCNPAAFNSLIQKVFADLSSFCKAYFDDLFVYTETNDMGFERDKDKHVYTKLSKCSFCASEIPGLGDFIGIHHPDKVRMIQKGQKPHTKCELQSFLGT
ncbi:hypothetical protein PHMEG_00015616 [Phytophthora megakarya]|uniref:Reverse transcriptase domain-containing protein n=1 Tax=Phytophthora megakarya TaxID=4795 RepID=A0A225W2X8_9STRA|nr:hypothetical protein PHMEG_00015616 [Phytophthora megakarya]